MQTEHGGNDIIIFAGGQDILDHTSHLIYASGSDILTFGFLVEGAHVLYRAHQLHWQLALEP